MNEINSSMPHLHKVSSTRALVTGTCVLLGGTRTVEGVLVDRMAVSRDSVQLHQERSSLSQAKHYLVRSVTC